MDTVLERVTTLGPWCYTKSNVNLYFQPTIDPFKTKEKHSDLLDWVLVSDYKKLTIAIANKFSDFFELDDFVLNEDTKSVLNLKYDILWHH